MVAIKPSAVDAFIDRPPADLAVVLVFGPDAGLVAERVETLTRNALDGSSDPFALVRLEGDEIASDPGRLSDEANTIALFGGKRAVRVRVGGRSMIVGLEALLGGPAPASLTILEAGDLKKNAPLRALCERHPRAAAAPCYPDEAGARSKLIDAELAAAGLKIADDARALLLASLSPNRLAAREDVRKLCLFAMGSKHIEADDVSAIVADAAEAGTDEAVDAAFAGRPTELAAALAALRSSGAPASVTLAAALRHGLSLHRMRGQVDEGRSARMVVEGAGPQIHVRRKAAVERALVRWSADRLTAAVTRLGEAVATSRRSSAIGEAAAERALFAIGQEAARLTG